MTRTKSPVLSLRLVLDTFVPCPWFRIPNTLSFVLTHYGNAFRSQISQTFVCRFQYAWGVGHKSSFELQVPLFFGGVVLSRTSWSRTLLLSVALSSLR